jgi:hypothetical protein
MAKWVRLVGRAMILRQDANLARKAAKRPPDAPILLLEGATPRRLRLVRDLSDAAAGGEQDDIIAAVAAVVLAYRAFAIQAATPQLPGDAPRAIPACVLEHLGAGDAA